MDRTKNVGALELVIVAPIGFVLETNVLSYPRPVWSRHLPMQITLLFTPVRVILPSDSHFCDGLGVSKHSTHCDD